MADDTDHTFVFSIEAVRKAIDNLTANPIHEHFSGYLAVLRAMRGNGGQAAKMSDIHEFHTRYLLATKTPSRRPFIRPFKSRGKGLELFNANVSGSYSPSSIRSQGKLADVLAVSGAGQNADYNLHPDHAKEALTSLLGNKRVPAVSLAAFLYRDFGFHLEERSTVRVLDIFRDEFGLRESQPSEKVTFDTLFVDDLTDFPDSVLEPLETIEPTDG